MRVEERTIVDVEAAGVACREARRSAGGRFRHWRVSLISLAAAAIATAAVGQVEYRSFGSEVLRTLGTSAAGGALGSEVTLQDLHQAEDGFHVVLGRAERSKILFFTASDLSASPSKELLRTDGTQAGTFKLFGPPGPTHSIVVGDRLLWSVALQESIEVWSSDGSASGTVRLYEEDFSPLFGPFPFFTARESAVSPRGDSLFVRESLGTQEPWITDGTAAGTRSLMVGVAADRVAKLVAGEHDVFVLTETDGQYDLWRVAYDDPTPVRLWQGSRDPGPSMVLAGQELQFVVTGDSATENSLLFQSDGSVSGTSVVGSLPELQFVRGSVFVAPFAYFTVSDGRVDLADFPQALWRASNGGSAEKVVELGEESTLEEVDGLVLLVDSLIPEEVSRLFAIREQGVIDELVACQPSCVWNGNVGSTGSTFQFLLWDSGVARAFVTDGTAAGTRSVWAGSLDPLQPFDSVSFGEAESLFVLGPDGDPNESLVLRQLSKEGQVLLRDFGAPRTVYPTGSQRVEDDGAAVFAVQERRGASVFYAVAAAPKPCSPTATVLCLGQGRFEAEVEWTDFDGGTGLGQVRELTEDTGSFWFFTEENLELIVKVVDGTPINDHHWVFYGSLSDVAYRMTVTDTRTGRRRVYENPSGTFASRGDVEALLGDSGEVIPKPDASPSQPELWARAPTSRNELRDSSSCATTEQSLCLVDRFSVVVRWTDFSGGTGEGTTLELTSDTGGFWFFDSENVELVVKVLDGRPVNGQFWVFYGALSDVAYEIEVTDTLTGVVRVYDNPAGSFGSLGDIEAFDG